MEQAQHPPGLAARLRGLLAGRDFEREAPFCAACPQAPTLTYEPISGLADLIELDFEHVLLDPANKRMERAFL